MRDGTQIGTYANGQLPNITGYISLHTRTKVNGSPTGAFYIDSVGGNYSGNYWEGGQGNLGFDASRSSSVYNNDELGVVPRHLTMNFIIKH